MFSYWFLLLPRWSIVLSVCVRFIAKPVDFEPLQNGKMDLVIRACRTSTPAFQTQGQWHPVVCALWYGWPFRHRASDTQRFVSCGTVDLSDTGPVTPSGLYLWYDWPFRHRASGLGPQTFLQLLSLTPPHYLPALIWRQRQQNEARECSWHLARRVSQWSPLTNRTLTGTGHIAKHWLKEATNRCSSNVYSLLLLLLLPSPQLRDVM